MLGRCHGVLRAGKRLHIVFLRLLDEDRVRSSAVVEVTEAGLILGWGLGFPTLLADQQDQEEPSGNKNTTRNGSDDNGNLGGMA